MGKYHDKKFNGTKLKVTEIDQMMLEKLGINIDDVRQFAAMARGMIKKGKEEVPDFKRVREDARWDRIGEEFKSWVIEQYGGKLCPDDVSRIARQRAIMLRIYAAWKLATHYVEQISNQRMTFPDQMSRISELNKLIERLTADFYGTGPMEKSAMVNHQRPFPKGNHAPNQSA
jgi:hypothetical protein